MIDIINAVQTNDNFKLERNIWKLLMVNSNTWNPLTVCKQMINIKHNY